MPIWFTYGVNPIFSRLWNNLSSRLSSPNFKDFLVGRDSTAAELEKLKLAMDKIGAVINDAAIKQHSNSGVKEWYNNMILAVCEAEDLIDDCETAVKMDQISQSQEVGGSLSCFGINMNDVRRFSGQAIDKLNLFREGIDTKLEKLTAKFKNYADNIDILGLRSDYSRDPSSSSLISSTQTTSVIDDGRLIGRDSQRQTIIEILKSLAGVPEVDDQSITLKGKSSSSSPTVESITVIAITGMPGIGKTALAQLIYNDKNIANVFDNKVWLCLTQNFNIIMIVKSIVAAIPSSYDYAKVDLFPWYRPDFSDLANELDLRLKDLGNKVAGKRILIILDGVRENIQNDVWQHLLYSIGAAASGSAIILTTSNESIATSLHPSYTLHLEELPIDDCWKLFEKEAYPNADLDQKWKTICEKIVAKCKGLPLAIKALGQLFKNTLREKEKENIATSPIWDLHPDFERKQPILPALWLNYEHLPGELKSCFAYSSIFPKSYQFDKKELVYQWMAQGFINQVGDDDSMTNEIGNAYFDELKVRSFFQVSFSNKMNFVMHDLFHDLATCVMGGFGFMLKLNDSPAINRNERLLHFSFEKSDYDSLERLGLTASMNQLRTFLPIETSFTKAKSYFLFDMVQSLQQFSCLRVFSLRGYRITYVPPSIGCLKHLRYLDLSFTLIEDLPDIVGYLIHLQVLLLSNCHFLQKLPMTIKHLTSLVYLDIRGSRIKEMPCNFGRLYALQILSNFEVGLKQGKSIKELGDLWQLRESLSISGLKNVVAEEDASAVRLSTKTSLEELIFEYNSMEEVISKGWSTGEASSVQEVVLCALEPPIGLKRLSINSYCGDVLPNWLSKTAFLHLEDLYLVNCNHCVELPSLGHLPSLKHLKIEKCGELTTWDLTASPPFKSLVTLKFSVLRRWKHWHAPKSNNEIPAFPCLQELWLEVCLMLEVKLTSLNPLPHLKILSINYCPMLSGFIPHTPVLRELTIYNTFHLEVFENLAYLTQLTKLHLHLNRHRSSYTYHELARIQEATQHLTVLQNLLIDASAMPVWDQLAWRVWRLPSSVTSITIRGFKVYSLEFIEHCRHLRYLDIGSFDSPLLFSEGQSQCLEYLRLAGYRKLNKSPIITARDDRGLQNLIDLKIEDCLGLEILQTRIVQAARHLNTLSFFECYGIRELPQRMDTYFPCLKFLSFGKCTFFKFFCWSNFPSKLETLRLIDCRDLESFPDIWMCESLQRLHISGCPMLKRNPGRTMPPNLRSLQITGSPRAFCDLVGSLESVEVDYREGYMRTLNKLTSLKELTILNVEGLRFPEYDLPESLTVLSINFSPDLKRINCGVLNRIPALRELKIKFCRNLEELSDGNLPETLCQLTLMECPNLEKKCSSPDGEYVKSKISNITCLQLGSLYYN